QKLGTKETFYAAAEKYGLPYPKTKLIEAAEFTKPKEIELPFDFSIALKPSDSIAWLDIHFADRKKAYV
ncbi:carboxylate--amine ligase, partial [Bifidobacterium longum]|nr:carboxylate--amine ligase [Bifidobacterium longum]